jgi:hypothetical protein
VLRVHGLGERGDGGVDGLVLLVGDAEVKLFDGGFDLERLNGSGSLERRVLASGDAGAVSTCGAGGCVDEPAWRE